MFCERCGRLRNRATGRCVCDDDPALATPPPAMTARVAEEGGGGVAVAVAPAPAVAAAPTAPAAPAVPPVVRVEARPAPLVAAADLARERAAAAPVVAGRLRGTVPDLRAGIARRYDLRVHDGAFVLHRVPGVDPLFVARVVGTLLLGPLGYLLGSFAGRRLARRVRATRLATMSIDAGLDTAVSFDQVVAVTLHRQPWGGLLRLGAGGEAMPTLRWSRRDVDTNEVAGLVGTAVGRRFSMHPHGSGAGLAFRAGKLVVLLAALAMIALPAKAIVFPAPEKGADLPAVAREALNDACPTWRATPLTGPQLAATAAAVRADFERAAAAAPAELSGLGEAIGVVEVIAPRAMDPSLPLPEAARFSHAIDTVEAACTRVG